LSVSKTKKKMKPLLKFLTRNFTVGGAGEGHRVHRDLLVHQARYHLAGQVASSWEHVGRHRSDGDR